MKKLRNILTLLVVLVILNSCLKRQFVEGRAEIVSTADSALHDSSLIYGNLYRVDWSGKYYYENEFEIWLENSDFKTTNDTTGYYSLIIEPGIYTIKCQSTGIDWERLIEEVDNIEFIKNQKTKINFYIGYTIE